ncbi:cysteine desulfurase family protein [Microbacterium sp. H37-C3]|uniref:cysteine desulfurase family protein n=1 Tax=Microbacterium sp. H37-C3 TaxID=3004354 RepID=UPI0022AEAE04|nr:cysteine desulfurase family protein [Microbacterium sp. H37-C3]MCZ4066511.1 cysteine desulfurase family protein [Microbacterium sp. H37-C3]
MVVYLDHAATTALRPEARDAWLSAHETLGNASSVHGAGQAARRLLEDARDAVASALGCEPIEVIFTSGGTEAINLAVKGLWLAAHAGAESSATGPIVLPDGEHHATIDAVAWLASRWGAAVRPVGLDSVGRIDPALFADALPGAALATALVANNEVGTRNDAAALARAARDARVPLHLDAVAALGTVALDFAAWRDGGATPDGLVAMSVSGHKVGAPVGTGALVVSRQAQLTPLAHGGGQQRGLRAGTQDVAGAAAFAAALDIAEAERAHEAVRVERLRGRLIEGIRSLVPSAVILGDLRDRLPGNVHVLFPGTIGETLLFLFDTVGIAVSTGSACQAGVTEPSHVVLALGRDADDARAVLRLTLGRTSTDADVDAFLAALPEVHRRAVAARAGRAART